MRPNVESPACRRARSRDYRGAAIGPFMRASNAVKKQFGKIEKTVGVLLVATGVAFLTGGFQSVSLWLIETFPQFGQVG